LGEGLFISTAFWGVFILYAVVDRAAAGLIPKALHYLFCAAASAAFLWCFAGLTPRQHACLYAALVIIYFSALSIRRTADSRGRLGGLFMVVGVVSLIWAVGKIGDSIVIPRLHLLVLLGISFALVKVWTFCKDLYDGRIADPSLPAFLAYVTFFPCYLQGPMHYYGEFTAAFERRESLDAAAWVHTLHRLLLGLVKVLVVGAALGQYSLSVIEPLGWTGVRATDLAWRSVGEGLRIYVNFSGYCDIAISAGRILGIAVPENFNWPYLASNIREFWQRWHITFTRFLTQYLFIPFARVFQARYCSAGPTTTSTLAYMVTFLFCGFWHGSTPNFLAWGAYHGGALAIYDYIRQKRLAAARARKQLIAPPSPPMRALNTMVTFAVVSAGWLLFSLPRTFWTR